MNEMKLKVRYFELMERYCQLGRLLPSEDEIQEDRMKSAEAKVVLAEMSKTKAAMDAIAKRVGKGTSGGSY